MSEYTELEDAAWKIAASLEQIVDLLEALAVTHPAVQGARRARMAAVGEMIAEASLGFPKTETDA